MGQRTDRMTWEEMRKTFPDEWLLIVDYETDGSGHLLSGVVERHSKEKKEVYARPALQEPTAFRYTGETTFRGFREHAERGYNI